MLLGERGPVRVVDDVLVAGGEERWHRAWPALESTSDGDLVVAYKESPDHHITDQGVLYVARSHDGGRTWPDRRPIAARPGWGSCTHHGMTRLTDGSLLLCVAQGRHPGGSASIYSRGRFVRSADGGANWDQWSAELDYPFLSPTERGFSYGKIQELPDGRLMAPFYGVPRDAADPKLRILAAVFSPNGGRNWDDHSILCEDPGGELCPSETDVTALPDGRYLAIIRANAQRRLYRSWSEDGGDTWTPAEPTDMPGQCPALLTLRDGSILCAYRDMTDGRPGMSCAVSRDAGVAWEILGYLYRGSNWDCAYPSLAPLPQGRLACAYYTSAEPVSTGSCEIRLIIMDDRTE